MRQPLLQRLSSHRRHLLQAPAPTCPCRARFETRMLLATHGVLSQRTFWRTIRAGFREACKRVEAACEEAFVTEAGVALQSATAEPELEAFLVLLEERYAAYESAGTFPRLLLLSIPNAKRMRATVEKFRAQGSQILTLHGLSEEATALDSLYHFSSDEHEGGRVAGARFAQAGVRVAKCLLPRYSPNMSGIVKRCTAFVETFRSQCTGACTAEIVTVATPSRTDTASESELGVLLRNVTVDGLLLASEGLVDPVLPWLEDSSPTFRPTGRRLAVFVSSQHRAAADARLLSLLDAQSLFFAIDSGAWLQGFMPTLLGAYFAQTGQRLVAGDPTQPSVHRTGPRFETARPGGVRRRRATIQELHLDLTTHNQNTLFWNTFLHGPQLAAHHLGMRFRNCCAAGRGELVGANRTECDTATPNMLRYCAPALLNDVGSMAAFLSRSGAQGTHGVVSTLSNPALLEEPIRALIQDGIPVITTNSGSDVFRTVGSMAHVSQSESEAGYQAGAQAVAAGGVRALCIQSSRSNSALAQRCQSFAAGMLNALNRTRSPWLPASPHDYASVTTIIVTEFDFDAAAAREVLQQALVVAPLINFVLTTGGNLMRTVLPILAQAGRYNSSTTDSGAFVAPAGSPRLVPGHTRQPPFPPTQESIQATPILVATFDCGAGQVMPLFEQRLLAFCIEQQEIMQGYLPIILSGIRAITGQMVRCT